MKRVVLGLILIVSACGDDGPSNAPGNNEPTNNNNELNNNNETNNNQTNNNVQTNNNETNNNQTCVPTAGGFEICDGLDNDCNGLIDDSPDFDNLGEACSVGVGACVAEGVFVCSVTKTSTECDAVEGEPTDEICDGIDNDCDGEVDEGFGVGDACSAGDGACANDGVIECLGDGTAACNAVAGVPGAAELCNGMDDDCNGEVDEDFPTLGQPCSVGVGACAATGVYVCSGDQTGVVCSATAGTPSTEVCDGIDNDCDGEVDEGFNVGQACSAGLGLCLRNGQVQCQTDGTSACNAVAGTPPEVTETTCDGLDNDCDGQVDENCDQDNDGYCRADFTRVGNPAVCPLGGGDCNDNDAAINPGATEVCDGVDNNCSGTIDVGAVDQTNYYLDCDADGFAADSVGSSLSCTAPANSAAATSCGTSSASWTTRIPISPNVDCHPTNSDVYPGQTRYFSIAAPNRPPNMGSYDYDCNGSNDKRWTATNISSGATCPNGIASFTNNTCNPPPFVDPYEGWTGGSSPTCGFSAEYTYCAYGLQVQGSCPGARITETRTQECR